MKSRGVILVIDSYLVRKGLSVIINRVHGATVVRETDSISELAGYLLLHPDELIIITDSLFDQATDLYLEQPEILERTLLLTGKELEQTPEGIRDLISLADTKEEINRKLHRVVDQRKGYPGTDPPDELTEREKDIVKMVSLGLTNREIAEKLFLSTHTVTTHRKNITKKLGIKSASGLTIYAIVNNIITIEEASSKPSED